MKNPRNIAAILAVSGLVFVFLSGGLVPLLPGWLIWIGWVLISFGLQFLQRRWFWAMSAAWNLYVTLTLLAFTTWPLHTESMIYWYSRLHSIAAVLLSALSFYFIQRGGCTTHTQKKADPVGTDNDRAAPSRV